MKELISEKEFLRKFEKHKELFSEKELRHFLLTIKPSKVIARLDARAFFRLTRTESIQLPVWQKLLRNNLLEEVFPGKKEEINLLAQFIELEKEEAEKKKSYRWAIYDRIKLYPRLFDFSRKDMDWVRKKTLAYEKRLDNFLNKKKMKKFAIAGGILFGGIAILYGGKKLYDSLKDKESK